DDVRACLLSEGCPVISGVLAADVGACGIAERAAGHGVLADAAVAAESQQRGADASAGLIENTCAVKAHAKDRGGVLQDERSIVERIDAAGTAAVTDVQAVADRVCAAGLCEASCAVVSNELISDCSGDGEPTAAAERVGRDAPHGIADD